jgi:hypothetical protein
MNKPPISLLSLPSEVIVRLLFFLEVENLLRLSSTCKTLHDLTETYQNAIFRALTSNHQFDIILTSGDSDIRAGAAKILSDEEELLSNSLDLILQRQRCSWLKFGNVNGWKQYCELINLLSIKKCKYISFAVQKRYRLQMNWRLGR